MKNIEIRLAENYTSPIKALLACGISPFSKRLTLIQFTGWRLIVQACEGWSPNTRFEWGEVETPENAKDVLSEWRKNEALKKQLISESSVLRHAMHYEQKWKKQNPNGRDYEWVIKEIVWSDDEKDLIITLAEHNIAPRHQRQKKVLYAEFEQLFYKSTDKPITWRNYANPRF